MSIEANKRLVREAYQAVSAGDVEGFLGRLADDARWTMYGTHRFARTFSGKADILANLFGPLGETLAGGIVIELSNLVAEGDVVVVEARGKSATKTGGTYNNTYCNVLTLRNGKIAEVREYLDTELVTKVFGPLA